MTFGNSRCGAGRSRAFRVVNSTESAAVHHDSRTAGSRDASTHSSPGTSLVGAHRNRPIQQNHEWGPTPTVRAGQELIHLPSNGVRKDLAHNVRVVLTTILRRHLWQDQHEQQRQ